MQKRLSPLQMLLQTLLQMPWVASAEEGRCGCRPQRRVVVLIRGMARIRSPSSSIMGPYRAYAARWPAKINNCYPLRLSVCCSLSSPWTLKNATLFADNLYSVAELASTGLSSFITLGVCDPDATIAL